MQPTWLSLSRTRYLFSPPALITIKSPPDFFRSRPFSDTFRRPRPFLPAARAPGLHPRTLCLRAILSGNPDPLPAHRTRTFPGFCLMTARLTLISSPSLSGPPPEEIRRLGGPFYNLFCSVRKDSFENCAVMRSLPSGGRTFIQ